MSTQDKAVIDTAKSRQERDDSDIVTLSTGVRVKLKAVSPSLLAEVTSRIKYPDVPKFHNPDKDRWEENRSDPHYIADRAQVDQDRGVAAMDALALFGLELLDPIPDDGWETKLALLGIEFDHKNVVEREFYYKKHIALSVSDFGLLTQLSGVTAEGVSRAEASFRGDETRNTDS